jgi:hypothetical protein
VPHRAVLDGSAPGRVTEQCRDIAGSIDRIRIGVGDDVHDATAATVRFGSTELRHVDVILANTRPTPSSDATPSARRAPPDCQIPTTGQPVRIARSYAATIASQPSRPIAPPWMVASVANATTVRPLTLPDAVMTPEPSALRMIIRSPSS